MGDTNRKCGAMPSSLAMLGVLGACAPQESAAGAEDEPSTLPAKEPESNPTQQADTVPDGVALTKEQGADRAELLEIPEKDHQITRLEFRAGGSHSFCRPTDLMALLKDGRVFCWSRDEVDGECPAPGTHQGQVDRAVVQQVYNTAKKEFASADPKDREGCDGGWSSVEFYEQASSRFFSVSTACRNDDPMKGTESALQKIWDEVCAPGVSR